MRHAEAVRRGSFYHVNRHLTLLSTVGRDDENSDQHHGDTDGVGTARAAQGKDLTSGTAPVALGMLNQVEAS